MQAARYKSSFIKYSVLQCLGMRKLCLTSISRCKKLRCIQDGGDGTWLSLC